jgi:hypothetical protein
MIVELYTIAFPQSGEIVSELHTFDSEDKDDLFALSEYLEEEGINLDEMSQDEFETICRKYLFEDEVETWGQAFVNCVIVTKEQLRRIKNIQ